MAALGAHSALDPGSVVVAPFAGAGAEQIPSGQWLQVKRNSDDSVAQIRARWQTAMIVGAIWLHQHGLGDDTFRGGELVAPDDPVTGIATGWRHGIRVTDVGHMFKGSDYQDSKMTGDLAGFVQQNIAAASAAGLRIQNVQAYGLIGSVVEVTAVADDPVAYVKAHPVRNGLLDAGDPFTFEGVFDLIVDTSGKLVAYVWVDTGFQQSEASLGPAYAGLVPDPRVTTPPATG